MPEKHTYHKLLLVWKSPRNKANYAVGTLELKDEQYFFYYNHEIYKQAVKEGFVPFVGLSDVETIYQSNKLFSSFERRIPNTDRNDFKRFLKSHKINSSNVEWEYLCITQGRLATDQISFIAPIIYASTSNVALLNVDIAGWSHTKDEVQDYHIDDPISVQWDASNEKDREAVEVVLDYREKLRLGYIPKPFNAFFYKVLKDGFDIHARIQAKIPEENRPLILVACEMDENSFGKLKELHYMFEVRNWI
ncbi:HIRAN domain-containing protein [Saccharibacillus brassicae]|uniref:HIRAN domain-containing protein n=1 Tax=Saccharibacillus brassicae TaxID=2583377 RepID=A0A4Y6UV47_SACBS|nr:HIRAN domain-containing protein [Saccharibacillus brassicae]QDH20256.1 HIRAN domain-containing protein [Saccharibacillus brassicae]